VRQRVEGRGSGSFVYVEGIITDINQATKQYSVQLIGDEMVRAFSLLNFKLLEF